MGPGLRPICEQYPENQGCLSTDSTYVPQKEGKWQDFPEKGEFMPIWGRGPD